LSRALVIAHRGASGYRPENTLSAFELAVAQRADMIETDLHRTADGAVVVTHDEDLSGLGGAGPIELATLAEVRALDAGAGEAPPTLEEVLDRFGPHVAWNLELKRGVGGEYPGLETAALEAVRSRGLLGEVLFSSFYDPVLARLRALAPEARIGLLLSRRAPARAIERARALGAEAIHPEVALAGPTLVADAHAAGFAVYVFTVDDPGEMRRLLALGVDGLFTNYPDRMRRLVSPPGGMRAPS
jgi:glycerophosphoryl diester phosphodiesterase